jgi:hypothetical protein
MMKVDGRNSLAWAGCPIYIEDGIAIICRSDELEMSKAIMLQCDNYVSKNFYRFTRKSNMTTQYCLQKTFVSRSNMCNQIDFGFSHFPAN